jgi:hypothetical protein
LSVNANPKERWRRGLVERTELSDELGHLEDDLRDTRAAWKSLMDPQLHRLTQLIHHIEISNAILQQLQRDRQEREREMK